MKIFFDINIENYFSKKEKFKNLFSFEKSITKNKSLDFQILYYSRNLFRFEFLFRPIGEDHTGVEIWLGLLGIEVVFAIRDNRHWDWENWKWEEHDE